MSKHAESKAEGNRVMPVAGTSQSLPKVMPIAASTLAKNKQP